MHKDDLAALARSNGFPRISIYIPTHKAYPGTEQDPIRLSNALKEAEGKRPRRVSGMTKENGVSSMMRQASPAKDFAQDLRERGAGAMRLYGALFRHWRDCPSGRCRRAKGCRGDAEPCFRRWWRGLGEGSISVLEEYSAIAWSSR